MPDSEEGEEEAQVEEIIGEIIEVITEEITEAITEEDLKDLRSTNEPTPLTSYIFSILSIRRLKCFVPR